MDEEAKMSAEMVGKLNDFGEIMQGSSDSLGYSKGSCVSALAKCHPLGAFMAVLDFPPLRTCVVLTWNIASNS